VHQFPLPPASYRTKSGEAANYRECVKMMARCDRATVLTGPVALTLAVYRARKAGNLWDHLYVLLDALQGVFYRNVAQVVEIHATLYEDRHAPRVELAVTSCRGILADDDAGGGSSGADRCGRL
jgi:hypothetical protein